MKKIVLISTYCDTTEKVQILKNNITKIKSFGLDVLVISPLTLPSEIIELSDFVFFTKENPLLVWPVRSFTFWKSVNTKEGWVKMHHNLADYGWAGLYQVKKLSQIALSYDYDIFYHMIYDLVIDDVVETELINHTTNIVHPRRDPHNPDVLWETTLHFMVFDRPMMEKIVNEIQLDEYLRTNGVAEGEVLKWKNKYNIPTSNKPVKDLIYYWEDTDFFNYSKNENFKLYFNKNDECKIWLGDGPAEGWIDNKFKLFFYDVKQPIDISIVINGDEYNYHIQNTCVINIDYDSTKIYEFVLFDGDIKYDYTETIKKTNRNIFYYDELPFEIKYSNEIRVNTKDLTMVFDKDKLPFSFEFRRQINQRKIWGVELNSNAWATFPDVEIVDVVVKNNQDKLVYHKKWDVNTNGNFIYKKLWNYCKDKHNSKGVVVGTHNGEFGEWVPVAIDKLSEMVLVEASEKQFNELIKNYSSYDNLKFINQLVTKDGGETVFYEGGKGYTNTVVKRVIDYWETEPITETIRESIKFSDLITPDVNWVHTDVEGIDFELIMSLTDEKLSHLDIIIYEYNNSSDYERELINNFLIEKGFQTYREEGVSIAFK